MNITQFTNSFDACVGHAPATYVGVERGLIPGKVVSFFKKDGRYSYNVDKKESAKDYATIDEAIAAAKQEK